MSRDQIEDLLKRVSLAKPASGSRDRVLSGARERAAERARASYNATLKATSAALVVVVVSGILLDRAASRRVERLIYCPVAQREVETSTRELARELAERPPLAIHHIRRCIYEGMDMSLDDGLALESELFQELIKSDEAIERMRAYVATGQRGERGLIEDEKEKLERKWQEERK